jgi:hypothetical protein
MACAVDGYCHAEGDSNDCSAPAAPDAAVAPAEPECPACNTPPAACPSECETLAFEATGDCVQGECVYDPVVAYSCPYGCDPGTGACREDTQACAGVLCDSDVTCGGTCRSGSGCCFIEQYQKTSSNIACCDGADPRVRIVDCGDGQNHWVEVYGSNCGVGREGPANYGSPCVAITCERIVCPIP